MAVCVAAISGSWTASSGAIVLFGMWLPMFLIVGYASLIVTRTARLRFHAGPDPLNRTVIIGEEEQIHELRSGSAPAGAAALTLSACLSTAPRPTPAHDAGFADVRRHRGPGAHDPAGSVDTVLVALPWSAGEELRAIIDRISMAPVDVYIYPGMNWLNMPLRQKRTRRSIYRC